MPSSDSLKSGSYSILPSQDNTHDITYDLPSTKCLSTFRSMTTVSTSAAENRPLNHDVVLPLGTPPSSAASDFYAPSAGVSASDDGCSPRVLARFAFSPVAALHVAAIPFAIPLAVIEVQGRSWRDGLATFFIVLASMQLAWLVVALLTQSHFSRASGGG
ncbi:uncharacterized protein LY79DRAFT_670244 [Colletotrichum navitas]|uniref:Uncharacterized protein n=1 Tax=Colletotrichum navitas TaxID=681940 RepID=A0AAD8PYP3_9PEZI|nr:uncharacterized protein LY79DRAFT_670244 [Colletotrichum navitas]KAK1590092.1 hypothetical protein LY79DRAFT_670244 [Colletotrichum navitas]